MKSVVVTGGAGFIGCNFVRAVLNRTESRIVVFDKLTYAGSLYNLEDVLSSPRVVFVKGDIADCGLVESILHKHLPDCLINFAAETHVDRSIDDPRPFVMTNVLGTSELLETTRRFWKNLSPSDRAKFRFIQVSTDEVYGALGETGLFSETTAYSPNSPYAASKAAADHLARAYYETYGLPVTISNCSNNYGPYQFPEKLLPLTLLNALEGKPLPIYGDGGNVRDWLYVEDHCLGLLKLLEAGKAGEKYNIGGNNERKNLEVVDHICAALEEIHPAKDNPVLRAKGIASYRSLKTFVQDRPGHDRRYAIDGSKIRNELGWAPLYDFESGIKKTVHWYYEEREWCQKIQEGKYSGERLGLPKEEPVR
jgi:dTDP-glucose 4,6-dehydratase